VPDPLSWIRRPGDTITRAVSATTLLARAGLFAPMRPDVVPRALLSLVRDGLSPAAAYGYAAARYGGDVALVDERGSLTFAEVSGHVAAVAAALKADGVAAGDKVGVLCRNHSGLVITTSALSSIGADVVLMNTSASPSEVAAVLESQEIGTMVRDDELAEKLDEATDTRGLSVWRPGTGMATGEGEGEGRDRGGGEAGANDGDGAPDGGDPSPFRLAPSRRSRYILLTSGTTGTPKGASRPVPLSLDPLLAILSRIPLQARDTTLIASPLFHAWGFGNLSLAVIMSSTLVLRERFDPEETLAAIAQHRVRVLAAVPVMLQRLVDLPEEVRQRYDLSSLEVVASSGSAMPGELASRFMESFGPILYNIYGSTEAAWASIATPEDLALDPRTAGRAPYGTILRIVDDDGNDVPAGASGRILVGNALTASPGDPEAHVPAGFVATGDLGHFDENGLLSVDGREDDMIVSGGENIYPKEIEDVLAAHKAVREVAVVGVEDEEFGQRLRAAVVLESGKKVTEDQLKEHVRRKLARFKVPREIVFLDELPRNATGKTLNRELRDIGSEGDGG
jgi:acyl-CoA synthetase (AMP-forming)/AMP-acid ligase II